MPVTPEQATRLSQIDRTVQGLNERLRPYVKRKEEGSRAAVQSKRNEESFSPSEAKFIRFTIVKTNSGEPCLDELEIFCGEENVALASKQAKATCSSSLPGYAIHRLEHIHDGRFGNSHSWISNEKGGGWVQIELPEPIVIDRVVWGRDREGRFEDRLATHYRIEISMDGNHWTEIASSRDRAPYQKDKNNKPEYTFAGKTDEEVSQAKQWLSQMEALEFERKRILASQEVYAGKSEEPGPTHRLFRGEPTEKREEVLPETIAALGKLNLKEPLRESDRRLALADWIASKKNPLTARVIANRLWQFHMGSGLVTTPSDFGLAGAKPTHPELLDWLASELMDHDWSLKHLHRLILQSATYQQRSQPRADLIKIDAATEWWWRFPPRRLEAEVIRDSVLSVSGSWISLCLDRGSAPLKFSWRTYGTTFRKNPTTLAIGDAWST